MNFFNGVFYVFLVVLLFKMMGPWDTKIAAAKAVVFFAAFTIFGLVVVFGIKMAISEMFNTPMIGVVDLFSKMFGLATTGGPVVPGLSAELFILLTISTFVFSKLASFRTKAVMLLLIILLATAGSTYIVRMFNISTSYVQYKVVPPVTKVFTPHKDAGKFWQTRKHNVKGQNGHEFRQLDLEYDKAIAMATTPEEFDEIDQVFVEKHNKLLKKSKKREHPWLARTFDVFVTNAAIRWGLTVLLFASFGFVTAVCAWVCAWMKFKTNIWFKISAGLLLLCSLSFIWGGVVMDRYDSYWSNFFPPVKSAIASVFGSAPPPPPCENVVQIWSNGPALKSGDFFWVTEVSGGKVCSSAVDDVHKPAFRFQSGMRYKNLIATDKKKGLLILVEEGTKPTFKYRKE